MNLKSPKIRRLVTPFVVLLTIALVSFALMRHQTTSLETSRLAKAEQFWNWFATIERDLHRAESTHDPAVKALKGKLEKLNHTINFQLGPIHQDNPSVRELAFKDNEHQSSEICTRCWDGPTTSDLLRVGCKRRLQRWLIGYGFDYKPSPLIDEVEYFTDDGQKVVAHPSDFLFEAFKNEDRVDVVVYTDKPIVEDSSEKPLAIYDYIKRGLGTFFFYGALGDITIRRSSDYKGNRKLPTIEHLYRTFEQLLPDATQPELNATLSSTHSCVDLVVEYLPEVDRLIDVDNIGGEPNPYLNYKEPVIIGVRQDPYRPDREQASSLVIERKEFVGARTSAEWLSHAEVFWRCCQIDVARKMATNALSSAKDETERTAAETFLRCRIPLVDVTEDARNEFNAAMTSILNEEFLRAKLHLKKCLELSPKFEWPYRHLSSIERKFGHLQDAEASARKSVSLNPNYARGWAELAEILHQRGNDIQATEAAKKAYVLDSHDWIVETAYKLYCSGQSNASKNPFVAPINRLSDWMNTQLRELDFFG